MYGGASYTITRYTRRSGCKNTQWSTSTVGVCPYAGQLTGWN